LESVDAHNGAGRETKMPTRTTQLARDIARRDATNKLADLDRKANGTRVRCDAKTTTREATERRDANLMIGLCDMADELAAREAREATEWPIPEGESLESLYCRARAEADLAWGWMQAEDGDAMAEEQLRKAAYYLRAIIERKAAVAA